MSDGRDLDSGLMDTASDQQSEFDAPDDQPSRGPTLQERIAQRRKQQQRFQKRLMIALAIFVLCTIAMTVLSFVLHAQRDDVKEQQRVTQTALDELTERSKELERRLTTAETQLGQLTTDATGKDGVIKTLQDETTAKQTQIDSLNTERAALKGCLDGVTLALVQLTNDGSNAARSTIDGVRDVCRQAEVLL